MSRKNNENMRLTMEIIKIAKTNTFSLKVFLNLKYKFNLTIKSKIIIIFIICRVYQASGLLQ